MSVLQATGLYRVPNSFRCPRQIEGTDLEGDESALGDLALAGGMLTGMLNCHSGIPGELHMNAAMPGHLSTQDSFGETIQRKCTEHFFTHELTNACTELPDTKPSLLPHNWRVAIPSVQPALPPHTPCPPPEPSTSGLVDLSLPYPDGVAAMATPHDTLICRQGMSHRSFLEHMPVAAVSLDSSASISVMSRVNSRSLTPEPHPLCPESCINIQLGRSEGSMSYASHVGHMTTFPRAIKVEKTELESTFDSTLKEACFSNSTEYPLPSAVVNFDLGRITTATPPPKSIPDFPLPELNMEDDSVSRLLPTTTSGGDLVRYPSHPLPTIRLAPESQPPMSLGCLNSPVPITMPSSSLHCGHCPDDVSMQPFFTKVQKTHPLLEFADELAVPPPGMVPFLPFQCPWPREDEYGASLATFDELLLEERMMGDIACEKATQRKTLKGKRLRRRKYAGRCIDDGIQHGLKLWQFLLQVLVENKHSTIIRWTSKEEGMFKVVDSEGLARLWGEHKNRPDMNYDKMSRAMRYYYNKHLLDKVPRRLYYQFRYFSKWWEKIESADPSFKMTSIPEPPKGTKSDSTTDLPSNAETTEDMEEVSSMSSEHDFEAELIKRCTTTPELDETETESHSALLLSTAGMSPLDTSYTVVGGDAGLFSPEFFSCSPPPPPPSPRAL